MDIKSIALAFRAVAVVAFLAGCSAASFSPEPYVWRPYTIDRDHEDFPDGPVLEAGSEISVCYAKAGATPVALKQLANDECGRFGLLARYQQTDMGICPLLTPSAAQFSCELPEGQIAIDRRSVEPGNLFVGNKDVSAPGSVLPPSFSGIGAADVSTTAKSAPYPTYLFDGKQKRP